MKRKKSKLPLVNASDFARLVNLFNLEKRDTVVGAKVERSVKNAIRCVLKPGQTPSDWIRQVVVEKLTHLGNEE